MLAAVAMAIALFALYAVLVFFGAACSDGFYSRTRSGLCDIYTAGDSMFPAVFAAVVVPPVSVLVVAALSDGRRLLAATFAAWVFLAVVSGAIIILIASGDL